jgi:hypothetical protein
LVCPHITSKTDYVAIPSTMKFCKEEKEEELS